MALPTVISQLIVLIYNMADTFFIGRANNPCMVAAASLILPVFNVALSLSGLAGIGGGALISRLLGEKRPQEARRVYSFCVYLCAAVSALFSLAVLLAMRPLLLALGAGDETLAYARQYAFFVLVCGCVPTVLSNTLSALLRSVGESGKAGFGIAMGGLLNIALDPLVMFVLLPPGYEIAGAGFATFCSNVAACAYFAVAIRRSRQPVLRLLPPTRLPARQSVAGVFSVGIPSAVATLLFDLDYIVIDRLMAGYGHAALAAVGIVLKAERLPLNVGIGICQGMMPLVAYSYAAGQHNRMRAVKGYALRLGLAVALGSVALYQLLAGGILRVFIADPATVALGVPFLRVRSVATPLMFLSFFHVYLFNAFGQGRQALFLGVVRWLGFNIPMLFALEALFGKMGIVWAQSAADALTVALSLAVYAAFARRELAKP